MLINSYRTKIKQHSSYCTLDVFMYSSSLLVMEAAPPRQLPRLSAEAIVGVEGRCCGWAPGSQTVSHTLLIGSYWPLGDNKNTPSSLHLSPLPGFTGNRSHLFQHNDIILIGAATVGLHLLALGIVIRQRWVMLIRAAKGKEPLTQPGGQTASAVSGSPLQT